MAAIFNERQSRSVTTANTLTSTLEPNGGRYRLGYLDREREILLTIPYRMSKCKDTSSQDSIELTEWSKLYSSDVHHKLTGLGPTKS